jgi:hypothetical protein
VHQRRVLAAIDRPEEPVRDALAADAGDAVGRDEKTGRPIVFLGRVVHHRQVEHRHALDVQDGIGEQRVIIDVEGNGAGREVPSRRRLNAAAEPAIADLVLLEPDLLDGLAEEIDVGILAGLLRHDNAGNRRCGPRRLDVGDA